MTDLRLSFEYFPPKTPAGQAKLAEVHKTFQALDPAFCSVTYGAGGSTRDTTRNIVKMLQNEGSEVAPHLSFGGDDETVVLRLLNEYRDMGIRRIVALRGDRPSGMGGQMVYASELVAFIRTHFGDAFHIEVAAYPEIHPEAASYDADMRFLKAKLDAGANSAITQYFYNPDAYFFFLERCQKLGIDAPIYPGIMPITNYKNLARFSDNCGAEIPRWMRKHLEGFGEDTAGLVEFGIELVTELCETLLDNGAPGLHFYTMNQTEPCLAIVKNLGLAAD